MTRFLAALLFLGLAAASGYYVFGVRAPSASVRTETHRVLDEAKRAGFEQAADWWMNAAARQKAGDDIRGSGVALALAIRLGRAEALRQGVQPLPAKLRRRFAPHFPRALLDEVRWTVADPGSRLGRALARWPVSEGAVTLGNVVVFKTEKASKDKRLFAHEIAHVSQYRKLGIDEFARRYAADPTPIEDEARTKARRVVG